MNINLIQNNKSPLVSIVIPAYNAELYLEACLESVSLQTYHNFEVNIIDDGSTDRTKKIAMEYSSKDKRFHYFYQKNQGLSESRNHGIRVSHGKYLLFLDSDDLLNKKCLNTVTEQIELYKADICVFGTEIHWIEDNYKIVKCCPTRFGTGNPQLAIIIEELLKSGLFNYAWNKLYKKEKLTEVKFKKGSEPAEDFIFNCEYFSKCSSLLLIEDVLYSYIKHGSDSLVEKYFPNLEKVYEEKKIAWTNLVKKLEFSADKAQYLELEREFYEKESFALNLLKSKTADQERLDKIKKYVLNTDCKDKYNSIQNLGLYEKIFKLLCNFNSPRLMLLSYKIMAFLKLRFNIIHRKIRKLNNLYLAKK